MNPSSKNHPTHPYLTQDGIIVMAHRGAQGLWPPNTLYAFERAVALGVDVLEMDIHSTSDGVLVVRHDPTVDNTTDGSGYIRDFTMAELKTLDAGYTWTEDGGKSFTYRGLGITIPTLEEVIQAFPGFRLNIDIKPADPSVVEPFCRILSDYDILDRVMVASFHDGQLRLFRQMCPGVATAATPGEVKKFYLLNRFFLSSFYRPKFEAFQTPEYAGGYHLITPRFIKACHNRNIHVHVWTVNRIEHMQRLLDWGVDGMITDHPDRLMSLLRRSYEPSTILSK